MDLRLIDRHSHVVIVPTRDLTAQNIAGQMRAMIAAVSRQSVNNGQTEIAFTPPGKPVRTRTYTLVPCAVFPTGVRTMPADIGSSYAPHIRPSRSREHPVEQTTTALPIGPSREPVGQRQSSTDSAPKSPLELSAGD